MQDIIGKGGYGKVRKINDQLVQKQFYKDYDQEKLRTIQSIIHSIDPDRKYFGGEIKQYVSSKKIHMINDGISLYHMTINLSSHFNIRTFQTFLFTVPQLIEGLILLKKADLIHGDIKIENILFDKIKVISKYIDYDFFGTISQYKTSQKENFIYPENLKTFFYYLWPLERFMIHGKFKYPLHPDTFSINIYKKLGLLITQNDVYIFKNILLLQDDKRWKPDSLWLKKFLDLYRTGSMRQNCSKIDIYSLGITLGEILIPYMDYILPSIRKNLLYFIQYGLLNPNISDRYTPEKALFMWKGMFSIMNIPNNVQQYAEKNKTSVDKSTLIEMIIFKFPKISFYNLLGFIYCHFGFNKECLEIIITREISHRKYNVFLIDLLYVANQMNDIDILIKILQDYYKKYHVLKKKDIDNMFYHTNSTYSTNLYYNILNAFFLSI